MFQMEIHSLTRLLVFYSFYACSSTTNLIMDVVPNLEPLVIRVLALKEPNNTDSLFDRALSMQSGFQMYRGASITT